MKKTCCLLLLLLILLGVTSIQAQPDKTGPFTVTGQVVDSLTSETVPYATLSIALASDPQKPVKLLACDDDGKFTTSLPQAGQYIATIQFVGKVPAIKTFTINENAKNLNLGKLYMQDQSQQLGEVTVTAQKPLVKVEIDKISYSLEDDPEAVTSNTLEMLRKVPMVTVDGEDKIQLKGSENYKIYLNGKPSNLLSNNPSDVLKSMPASSVKNIEVITDPGAKYDAEGVGGIINIITNQGSSLQGYTGTVRAQGSTLGRYGGGAYLSAKIGKVGVTGNFNYNYQNNPWNESFSMKENYTNVDDKYTNQVGRNKYSGPFQYGNLEVSYEIDTLNLISLGVNRFGGRGKNEFEYDVENQNENKDIVSAYERITSTDGTFGSTDLNLDYQRSTKKKDELLTVSYRFSNTPNDSEGWSNFVGRTNFRSYNMWNTNEAYTNEHTGQIDYTTPLRKDHTLDVGVKYILRQNNSETEEYEDTIAGATPHWQKTLRQENFTHTQHIYSAYTGYSLKAGKFGAKAGFRTEGTSLDVKDRMTVENNFDKTFFDFVPNATLSYMIDMAKQMRIGYNMRIQRPSIRHLNPYINRFDPQNISYGNPNLDSEKSHNISYNFSQFSQKLNLNASLTYTFVNNSIEQYTFVNANGTSETTYGNLGKRSGANAFLYINWRPTPALNFFMNGGVNYLKIKSQELNMTVDGFSGNAFAGIQYNFPMDFRLNLYGGHYVPQVMLQRKYSSQSFTGINLNKSLLEKKLTLSLAFQSPLWKRIKHEDEVLDVSFYQKSTSYWTARELRLSVSYTFGTMKSSATKKVRRSITNDDTKQGENGSGGGGEGMQQ